MFHPHGPSFWELARQALSSTERGYDLLAPKFDYTPFRTPAMFVDPVVELLADEPPSRALDLCCGTGAGLEALLPLCSGPVVGLDFSRGMLAEARRRLCDAPGFPRLRLVRGEALAPPFAGCFDAVTCFGAFGHIRQRDEARFVRAIHRVLRPGGRFVFITGRRPGWWSPGRWLATGFNLTMLLRNLVLKPRFIMYYLTFLLPEVRTLLERTGFAVEVRDAPLEPPWNQLQLVSARRIR